MAVKEVKEIGEMTFDFERQGFRTVLTAERNFKVFTDDATTGPAEVIIMGSAPPFSAPDAIPAMDSFYAIDNEYLGGLWVRGIHPRRSEESPREWNVRVAYSSDVEKTLAGEGQGSNAGGNTSGGSPAAGGKLAADPLKRRTIINYDRAARKQIVEYDWTRDPTDKFYINRPVANSAGEKFDPPIEDDVYNLLIRVEKNTTVAFYDPKKASDMQGSVNSDQFVFTHLGVERKFEPGTAKLNMWTADEAEEGGIVFLKNKIEIEIQYPNWDWVVLNQGSYSISTDGKHQRQKVMDRNGIGVGGNALLNRKGILLPSTEVTSGAFGPGVATVTVDDITNISAEGFPNIKVRSLKVIDHAQVMQEEDVEVTATNVGAKTFTANFTLAHTANAIITGVPTFETFKRRKTKFSVLGI